MVGILHISDLHNRPSSKLKIIELRAMFPEDYLLVTGDITDDGEQWQYNNVLADMLLPWDDKLLACPGNHDARRAGVCFWRREGIKRFDAAFNTRFYGLNKPMVNVIEDKVAVIRLDSNCENWNWSLACGRIGRIQMRALDKMLYDFGDYGRGYIRIVALHHHPFDRGLGRILLDAKEFMSVVKDRCEVLCFGHKHLQQYRQWDYGIQWISAAGALFQETKVVRIIIEDDYNKASGVSVQLTEVNLPQETPKAGA